MVILRNPSGFHLGTAVFNIFVGDQINSSLWGLSGTGRGPPERFWIAPSYEAFRARVDVALGNLIYCMTTLPMAERLELYDL